MYTFYQNTHNSKTYCQWMQGDMLQHRCCQPSPMAATEDVLDKILDKRMQFRYNNCVK